MPTQQITTQRDATPGDRIITFRMDPDRGEGHYIHWRLRRDVDHHQHTVTARDWATERCRTGNPYAITAAVLSVELEDILNPRWQQVGRSVRVSLEARDLPLWDRDGCVGGTCQGFVFWGALRVGTVHVTLVSDDREQVAA